MKLIKKISVFVVLVLFLPLSMMAQDWLASLEQADAMFLRKEYAEALSAYRQLRTTYNKSIFNYKIGLCYLKSPNHKKDAASYIEKALTENDGTVPIDAFYYLGKAYHYNYRFVDAVNVLNEYLEKTTISDEMRQKANEIIGFCQNGKKLLGRRRIDVNVSFMDFPINTSYNEIAPIVSSDGQSMFLSSDRPKDRLELVFGDQFVFMPKELRSNLDDVYFSSFPAENTRWEHPTAQGIEYPYVATLSMTDDGEKLLVYLGQDESEGSFFVVNRKNNGDWQRPQPIDLMVDRGTAVRGACMASNGNVIYFSSNKPGGFGGFDIYKMHRIDGSRWSIPENLGEGVNSSADEVNPFMHPDHTSLYFSSNGHDSMGYFDIFRSKKIGASWTKALNLGDPINSVYDDDYFQITPDNSKAYLSSDRGGDGSFGSYDILKVVWGESPMPLTKVSGVIQLHKNGKSVPVQLKVKEGGTGAIQQYVYSPKPEDGKYFMVLFPNKFYSVDVIYEKQAIENIELRIEEDVFNYQYSLQINIDEVTAFGKVVADIVEIEPMYKTSSTTDAGAEDEIRTNRYDMLVEVLNKIIEYADSTGRDSLYQYVDDPLIPKEVEVQDVYDNLVSTLDRAIQTGEYSIVYRLKGPLNSLMNDVTCRGAYSNRLGRCVCVEGDFPYAQSGVSPDAQFEEDLGELASLLKSNRQHKIELVHVHSLRNNKSLSTNRLNYLRDKLMEKGVASSQILTYDSSQTTNTYVNNQVYDVVKVTIYCD
ncbi:hypothetical protein R9C00_26630 [Flammeovirgaceae bacterium SG7u.111]|nr:hypothetical protein [Flammeovirgaceae bacterium SG7u.132]WPO35276.1 hypothetical protein R9C00_26630 [Flammeovirgaceae bacterium SG7u.111]